MRSSARRALGTLLTGTLLAAACVACDHDSAPEAVIRVDQVGYAPGETKIAYLLSPRNAGDVRVTVLDAYGKKVLKARTGTNRGPWNAGFPDVRPIDLSALRGRGVYRIRVEGAVRAESPPFHIEPAADLFGPLAGDSLSYFQNHRDGANQVPSFWKRPPAHLTDRAATVYEPPEFDSSGRTIGDLVPVGGPVDVEGGWYDAGDFLKFTHTTAYALSAILIARRDGLVEDGLAAETEHGITWLDKMWDPAREVLYTQVGIGSGGNEFFGDHDTWRLPEADDRLDVQPGDERYYQRYRPVFRTSAPISPNLAGRVAAAFALAAQVEARKNPERARKHLDAAATIFGLARTEDVGELVTAEPRSFYPEDRWIDDLAFGAAELALAGRALGDSRTGKWTLAASRWARSDGGGPLTVYDVGALAEAETIRLLGGGAKLLENMRRRLDAGVRAAAINPMGAAAGNGGYDYAARQLGYAATAELYEHVSGDSRYAAFATAQRGVALGNNGWGTSMVVGAGTTYPRCPHDQIATLTVAAETGLSMAGAVVNGPNLAGRVNHLEATSGPATCRTDEFATFDRDDTHYADDSRISATTEPAIDFSATGLLAFALMAQQH